MAVTDVDVKRMLDRVESLKSDRANWENYWQDILKYTVPRKAYINRERTSGEELDVDIFDSTGINAAQVLAAGLQGHLTNPSAEWFSLRTQNEEQMNDKANRVWLESAQRRILAVLNNSNFNQEIHEFYIDIGTIGTATIYSEEDTRDLVRFFTRPIKEIFIVENERGRIEEVYRKFELTAQQAIEAYGINQVGEHIVRASKDKPGEKFEFIHCVKPRAIKNPGSQVSTELPFESVTIEVSKKKVVKESGYTEFPFNVARFSKGSEEVYGFSPAMIALPDIRMLNRMSKTIIKAAQKIVDPPLFLPHDGFLLPLVTKPGGINYRLSQNPQDEIRPLETRANIPVGIELENQRRDMINRAFFVDLFQLLAERKNMTATEVLERVQEKMLILGPAIGRLMSELLDPIIIRVFNMMLRARMIEPAPKSLQQQKYIIKYQSPLAKAQKISALSSLRNFILDVGQMAQFDPTIGDNIDMDKVVIELHEGYGPPTSILRGEVEKKRIREQRQQALQAQAQMAAIAQTAETAKTGAEALDKVKNGRAAKTTSRI